MKTHSEIKEIDLARIEAEARRMRAAAFRNLILGARRGLVSLVSGHGLKSGRTA